MIRSVAAMLAFLWAAFATASPRYLPTIQQRWDASDLVCTAVASAPTHTGVTQRIDNADRDQLAAEVVIENCFKGSKPELRTITVLGYSVYATKDFGRKGFIYSGAPAGFVNEGRNLVFLKRTGISQRFEMVVPIYQSAVRLADSRPYYPTDNSSLGWHFALTQEFEAALLQFDAIDVSYIHRIFDLLGSKAAALELRGFSARAPLNVQRDIAVSLLNNGEMDCEPLVISLLQDSSAPAWKRENAAHALGKNGTQRALPYLHQLAAQPVTSDDLKTLRVWAVDALQQLQCRLSNCRASAN